MAMTYEQLRELIAAYTDHCVQRSLNRDKWYGMTTHEARYIAKSAIQSCLLEDLAYAVTDNRPNAYLDVLTERWQMTLAEEKAA